MNLNWIPRGDSLKWVAAGCALVATASAEYEIARTIGMNEWVAAAVPGALDAYVLRALRAHREVLVAVLAMIGVNAASHLVTAGLLPLDWKLVTAVSAIAPLVLWRVHALGAGARTEEHTGTVSVPPPLPVRVPGEHVSVCLCAHGGEHGGEHESLCVCSMSCTNPCGGELNTGAECFCGATVWGDIGAHQRAPGHPSTPTVTVEEPYPDSSLWSEHNDVNGGVLGYSTSDKEPRDCPVYGCAHGDGHVGECLILPAVPAHVPAQWSTPPVLRIVKDTGTPSTDGSEHVTAGVLIPYDLSFLERARVLAGQSTDTPTVRALKDELNVGTPRAQRLRAALKAEKGKA